MINKRRSTGLSMRLLVPAQVKVLSVHGCMRAEGTRSWYCDGDRTLMMKMMLAWWWLDHDGQDDDDDDDDNVTMTYEAVRYAYTWHGYPRDQKNRRPLSLVRLPRWNIDTETTSLCDRLNPQFLCFARLPGPVFNTNKTFWCCRRIRQRFKSHCQDRIGSSRKRASFRHFQDHRPICVMWSHDHMTHIGMWSCDHTSKSLRWSRALARIVTSCLYWCVAFAAAVSSCLHRLIFSRSSQSSCALFAATPQTSITSGCHDFVKAGYGSDGRRYDHKVRIFGKKQLVSFCSKTRLNWHTTPVRFPHSLCIMPRNTTVAKVRGLKRAVARCCNQCLLQSLKTCAAQT